MSTVHLELLRTIHMFTWIADIVNRPLNNMCSMFNFSEVTFEFTGAAQFAASM